MIGFFCAVLFVSFIMRDQITIKIKNDIVKDIIFINFICALFIIIQYYMFRYHGIRLFKLDTPLSYGGVQTNCNLLFEDTSCSTIMLGCGGLYAFLLAKNRKHLYLVFLIILVGLALTSRRTSVISLLIILCMYSLIHYKNAQKVFAVVAAVTILGIGLYILNLSRPTDNLSQFVNENGRFPDYISGLELFGRHPLLGIGYDNINLASLMTRGIIPHNTILRWLDMGGLILTIPLVIIIGYCIINAYRKGFTNDFWVLLYTVFASNLIPDILNGRFFVILCCMVLFTRSEKVSMEPQNQKPEQYLRRLSHV